MELRPSHFKIYYINAFDKNNNHLLNKWRKHTKKRSKIDPVLHSVYDEARSTTTTS